MKLEQIVLIKHVRRKMMDIKYSNHAEEELLRRKITKEIIADIINYPEQRIELEDDTFINQSIIEFDNKKK